MGQLTGGVLWLNIIVHLKVWSHPLWIATQSLWVSPSLSQSKFFLQLFLSMVRIYICSTTTKQAQFWFFFLISSSSVFLVFSRQIIKTPILNTHTYLKKKTCNQDRVEMSRQMFTWNRFFVCCQLVGSVSLLTVVSFSRRCHSLAGTWGRWIWVLAEQREPECRRSQQWGWGRDLPRRKTWTNRSHGQYHQVGHTGTAGNGKAQS